MNKFLFFPDQKSARRAGQKLLRKSGARFVFRQAAGSAFAGSVAAGAGAASGGVGDGAGAASGAVGAGAAVAAVGVRAGAEAIGAGAGAGDSSFLALVFALALITLFLRFK